MSLRDLMQSHAATVFLNTEHFGESVKHIAGGLEATVTAIVTIEPPERQQQDGDARVFRPKILVLESVLVRPGDTWRINGIEYQTEKIQPVTGDGLRTIELTRQDVLMRKGGRGG